MTEPLDTAISRLTAWVRDYGDQKQQPFIDDVRAVLEAATTVAALTAERDGLRELAAALVDEGDCRYDHHDLCQEHGLFQKPCPHEQAKQFLKGKRDS